MHQGRTDHWLVLAPSLSAHWVFVGLNFTQTYETDQRGQIILSVLSYMVLGHPKPKKMLIFRFVGIFEYIILLMLILFLDMCQNS